MHSPSFHPASIPLFVDRIEPLFEEGDAEVDRKSVERENVKKLREQYEALARGDIGPVIAMMADDVEAELFGPPDTPMTGRWKGRQKVSEVVKQNYSLLEDQKAQLLSLVAQGDTVVVLAKESGKFRQTGGVYDIHWVQFFKFRDGKVVHFRCLFDTAALIQAAQPAESRVAY